MSARILIVEDEAPIRRFLRVALETEGHVVSDAATAREGIALAARESPAAIILDLGLPDADGITVLRAVREWSQVPVLVLSVRSDEAGKIAALDAGAQDYVTKPFSTGELLARLRSLLRDRARDAAPAFLTLGPLVIDAADHRARLSGEDLKLTRKEFDLLWLLASHAGRLVTRGHDPQGDLGTGPCRGQSVSAGLHPPVAGQAGRRRRRPPLDIHRAGRGVSAGRPLAHATAGTAPLGVPVFHVHPEIRIALRVPGNSAARQKTAPLPRADTTTCANCATVTTGAGHRPSACRAALVTGV
ncbi:hypothetical protein MASR1M32_19940 [Rhodobacter sp.]